MSKIIMSLVRTLLGVVGYLNKVDLGRFDLIPSRGGTPLPSFQATFMERCKMSYFVN